MTEQYKCPSYYDDSNVLQDCVCGKCGDNHPQPEPPQGEQMRTCKVFRTAAKGTKPEHEQLNYNESDQVQFEAVEFSDGKVAQRWLTTYGAVAVWDSWKDLCSVHIYAHPDYGTRIEWSDGVVEEL